jgi:heterotetrameric sarcosine oxidase gamma subunit
VSFDFQFEILSMTTTPLASGPLIPLHRRAKATIDVINGWEIAAHYPAEPPRAANALIDLTGRTVSEINGPETESMLKSLCGDNLPIRGLKTIHTRDVYRLTNARAIVFGEHLVENSINVTGGWASIGLYGPQSLAILQKITAIDLRDKSLGVGQCAQGPVFGVNVLFGHFADHWELHACPDMTQFLWEVLLDAGAEFHLKPAGKRWIGA